MRPEVKICGLCSAADAEVAAAAGATWAGVILAPGRLRSRTEEEAAQILDAAALGRVGVFVDAGADDVLRAAERLRLDVVQLHGDEPPETVAAIAAAGGPAVWKAVRVRSSPDVRHAAARYAAHAQGLLLDGWSPHGHGGVGASFDWAEAAAARDAAGRMRVIVAGGLTPDNVTGAIAQLRPDVVDVSSGVEERLGCKSAGLVQSFIAAVQSASVASKGSP